MILGLILSSLTEQHNSHIDLTESHFIDLHQMKLTCVSFFPVLFWCGPGPIILPPLERE